VNSVNVLSTSAPACCSQQRELSSSEPSSVLLKPFIISVVCLALDLWDLLWILLHMAHVSWCVFVAEMQFGSFTQGFTP